jgi:threonine aldolase
MSQPILPSPTISRGNTVFKGIDLYSDTATKPSAGMKQAMMEAVLGDEQRGEDPTTLRLEELVAEMLNKQHAMFFPSATMCNQVAAKLHTNPGDEVLGAEGCHLFCSEGGALGFHSGAQNRLIDCQHGIFSAEEAQSALAFGKGPHTPRVSLLLVENTTNVGGGYAWPLDKLRSVVAWAKSARLKTHLDGARIFNAAVATKSSVKELSEGFDTVTICFSKGLSCPTGAILAFDNIAWGEARRLKQIFGGAMRQSGMLAAACLYALDHHIEDLAHDHEKARKLAEGLAKVEGVSVENCEPQSNIIYFSIDKRICDPETFLAECVKRGLRFSRFTANRFRAVTHRDVSDADIDSALEIVLQTLGQFSQAQRP